MKTNQRTPGLIPYKDYDPKRMFEAVEIVSAAMSKMRVVESYQVLRKLLVSRFLEKYTRSVGNPTVLNQEEETLITTPLIVG